MTNFEKYKTPAERGKMFYEFCNTYEKCAECPFDRVDNKVANKVLGCAYDWGDLEYEEELLEEMPKEEEK